jgi:hypothetical protein
MYVKQFLTAVEKEEMPPRLCLYNEGNILNPHEFPTEQLTKILNIARAKGARRVVLESRPEYITCSVLKRVREAIGNMEIEIGMGLESSNDFVRNELYLKSLDRGEYEHAICRLAEFDVMPMAYVTLKPPFLNEAQAIADAVKTAQYAFEVGTKIISLEPVGVEPHTITELLYDAGLFCPARLWSIIDVTLQISQFGGSRETRIGGFEFDPLPEIPPQNCQLCSPSIMQAFDQYNQTYDIDILKGLQCECYENYFCEVKKLDRIINEEEVRQKLEEFVIKQMAIMEKEENETTGGEEKCGKREAGLI